MTERVRQALKASVAFAAQYMLEVDNELTSGDPQGRRTEAACALYGALEAVEIAEEA